MAASKPTSRLSVRPHLVIAFNSARISGSLDDGLSCSSFGRDLSTRALTPGIRAAAFGVRQDLTGGEALASIGRSTSRGIVPRLHLNAFRGVRAISEFDWPFTPTHRSSGKLFNAYRFRTSNVCTTSSSCPCVDHSVSRLPPATLRPVRTRFPLRLRPLLKPLASPPTATRRFIMQKARRHHT